MGALIGLGVGVGALLVWSAFCLPRRPDCDRSQSGRAAPEREDDETSVTALTHC